jgi:hypothetical protein
MNQTENRKRREVARRVRAENHSLMPKVMSMLETKEPSMILPMTMPTMIMKTRKMNNSLLQAEGNPKS